MHTPGRVGHCRGGAEHLVLRGFKSVQRAVHWVVRAIWHGCLLPIQPSGRLAERAAALQPKAHPRTHTHAHTWLAVVLMSTCLLAMPWRVRVTARPVTRNCM